MHVTSKRNEVIEEKVGGSRERVVKIGEMAIRYGCAEGASNGREGITRSSEHKGGSSLITAHFDEFCGWLQSFISARWQVVIFVE